MFASHTKYSTSRNSHRFWQAEAILLSRYLWAPGNLGNLKLLFEVLAESFSVFHYTMQCVSILFKETFTLYLTNKINSRSTIRFTIRRIVR